MYRGIYTASNGMFALQTRMDTVANNLANVNTTGYKKDTGIETNQPNFPSILAYVRGMGASEPPLTFQGKGVQVTARDGEYTIVNDAGEMTLDYFGSPYLTKSGIFKADSEGYLATKEGHRLMGQNGPIQTNGQTVDIDKAGNISVGGQVVDKLKRTNPIHSIGIIDSELQRMNIITKHEQGELNNTGNTMDMAISGKGFFTVNTPDGTVYTRNGSFEKSIDGYLVTKDGYRVQGENGDIQIKSANIKVSGDGTIKEDGQEVGKLKMTDFEDYRYLQKVNGNTFRVNPDFSKDTKETAATAQISQGYLEASNVNSVAEMVDMIVVNRNYESAQKVIQSYDTIMGKSANEIGRLG